MAIISDPILHNKVNISGAKSTTATTPAARANEVATEIEALINSYLDGTEGTHERFKIEVVVHPMGL